MLPALPFLIDGFVTSGQIVSASDRRKGRRGNFV
jgi:hypothetical protein